MTVARPSRIELAALAAILLVAAAIRVVTAGYPLWFDEIASTVFAGQPYARLWSGWMVREANPPLYYSLLRGWIALFGDADRTLRALSIVIGLVGVGAGWAAARRLGGAFAGLAAAALIAVSAADVAMSEQVRGYALAHSATLVALVAIGGFLETRRRFWLVPYALAALTALYTHTMMAVFVGLVALAGLWLLRRDRPALITWLIAHGVIAIGWAWWVGIALRQMAAPRGTFGWIAAAGPAESLRIVEQVYLPDYLGRMGIAGAVLLVALLGWLACFAWRDRRPMVVLLAVLVSGAPVLLIAASGIEPVLLVRTLYWASAPLAVLVAVALGRLARAWRVGGLALIVPFEAAMLVHWLPARQLESWPDAIAAIERVQPDAVILADGDAMAIVAAHYLPAHTRLRLIALDRPPVGANHWADGLFAGPHVDAAAARTLLTRDRRVFALTIGDQDPGRVLGSVGHGRLSLAASHGQQPLVWIWSAGAQAALSMPSSPNLR